MYPKGTNTLSRWTRDSSGGMETIFSLMLFHPYPPKKIMMPLFVPRYFSYEYTLEGIAVEACEGGEGPFFTTISFNCG